VAVLLGVVVIVAGLFLFQTTLRFTYAPLNYVAAVVLAAAIPLSLGSVALAIRSPWGQWPLGCLTAVMAIPAVIVGVWSLWGVVMFSSDGADASFEARSELRAGHSLYRIYRTNGGAMTSFGIVLRKETTIVPGLMLVTRLRAYYPASEARLERLPDGRIRFTLLPYVSERRTTSGDTVEFQP
jgi:hypothetical protein